jgi:cytochrome oxidase assembly protein ShyY1
VLSLLRQPRYAALSVLMALVALVCIGAGTWQIARFEQKHDANSALRHNARAAPVTVAALLSTVGTGRGPARDRVEFRAVRATGTYESTQGLVRNRSVGDANGFLVLTPLRTVGGVLLVVRGFVPQPGSGSVPTIPSPPSGTVTIRGRIQLGESRHDQYGVLPAAQLESINPADWARRSGRSTFDGYVALDAHQPGTRGLAPVPPPDLSNPAGGALEPQHFAYVVQWYLFAALALAAPFAMARAETRPRRRTIDFDAESEPAADDRSVAPVSDDRRRAAKLADRYGRPTV